MGYLVVRKYETTRELACDELAGAGVDRVPVTYFAVWQNECDGFGELPVRGGDAGFAMVDEDGEFSRRSGRRVSLFSAAGLYAWLVANNFLVQADAHAAEYGLGESICGQLVAAA